MQKVITKKNILLVVTGLFSIYNSFAYPFIIAFKLKIYRSTPLLIMELLTLFVYSMQLIMLII